MPCGRHLPSAYILKRDVNDWREKGNKKERGLPVSASNDGGRERTVERVQKNGVLEVFDMNTVGQTPPKKEPLFRSCFYPKATSNPTHWLSEIYIDHVREGKERRDSQSRGGKEGRRKKVERTKEREK